MLKLTVEKRKYSEDSRQVRGRYLRYLEALCDHVLVRNHDLVSCQQSVNFFLTQRTAFGKPVVPELKLKKAQMSLFRLPGGILNA